uniref:Uncharacterized protein n=1 Tax=viral metagenome TaxID=1070528 RepID=A0A6C0I4F7_9ZZZZ
MEKEYKPKKQLYNNNIITLHNLYNLYLHYKINKYL